MPLYSQPNPAAGEGNSLLLPATFEHTLMNNKQRLKESLTEINPMLVLLAGTQNPATLPEYGARRINRHSPQTGTMPFDNEVTHANTRNRDMVD